MKTIAYTALHYGKDYLAAAIRSVIDAVDEYHVLYTPTGSHGHYSAMPCPESREELYEIARQAAGDKFHWHEGAWAWEGQQRDAIHTLVPDADVVLVLDADEIYEDGLAQDAITFALNANVRQVRLPFLHLWRSFRRGFAHDPAYPHRVICPKVTSGETTMPTDKRVWHAGYAQRPEIVAYKLGTHGHRSEFRRDVDWLHDVFLANRQYDCHPVGSDAWNCEDIDQTTLPTPLKGHPYESMGVIE